MEDTSGGLVAGYNQFVKLVRKGRAAKVYLANDADVFFVNGVMSELASHPEVIVETGLNSAELSKMAGIEVPAAVLTVIA